FHSSWRSAGAARPPRAASINTVRKSITPAARGLGIDVRLYEVRSGIELEPALAAAVRDGVQALYMSEAPHLLVLRGRRWRTCGYRRCTHSGNTCNPAGAGWTLGHEAAESPSAAVPGLSCLWMSNKRASCTAYGRARAAYRQRKGAAMTVVCTENWIRLDARERLAVHLAILFGTETLRMTWSSGSGCVPWAFGTSRLHPERRGRIPMSRD